MAIRSTDSGVEQRRRIEGLRIEQVPEALLGVRGEEGLRGERPVRTVPRGSSAFARRSAGRRRSAGGARASVGLTLAVNGSRGFPKSTRVISALAGPWVGASATGIRGESSIAGSAGLPVELVVPVELAVLLVVPVAAVVPVVFVVFVVPVGEAVVCAHNRPAGSRVNESADTNARAWSKVVDWSMRTQSVPDGARRGDGPSRRMS